MNNMNQHHNDAPDHQPVRENVARPNRRRHEEEDNERAVVNEDEVNDDDDRLNENDNDHNENNANRARKSGKKARRRDLDQRRDLRRQREAAMQIGLNGVNDGADDAVEVQRMIEEQIAAENNNQR